jgi:hypothetical protein
MKKVAVIATLAAGLGVLSAPAFAQTGHVGANFASYEGGDAESYGVDGAVAFGAGGLTVVLDAVVTDSDEFEQSFGGTVHLMSLNDNRAFGGYVGYTDIDVDTGFVYGVEYAQFFSNSTLALSGGLGNLDDSDIDITSINGEYRLFTSDNLRFDFGLGFANYDTTGGDADSFQYGVGVEYRFGGSPVSIGADYTIVDSDDLFGESIDVISATVRFDFGNGSLKARDRSGSSTFGPLGGLGGAVALLGAS